MKKIKKLSSIFLVMGMIISCFALLNSSKVLALNNVIDIQGGVSKTEAVEIASQIYYSKAGDTIVLGEGYYKITGQAYMFENNITIKGAGKDKTFVHINSAESGWGLTIQGNYCSVQDLTLERSTNPNNAAVIKVMGANNVSINNVRTIGGYYGIDLNPSIGSVIDGCEFTKTSKGSIGVGSANNTQSQVTIMNTTTREAGWGKDVVINDSQTYGNSIVKIGNGNSFTNGFLCNDNYNKSQIIFEDDGFPTYQETINGNAKEYREIPAIRLSMEQLLLEVGKGATISGQTSPAHPISDIKWSSSDEKIAQVDASGNIIAIAKGSAIITASAGKATANCAITTFKTESEVPSIDTSKPVDKVDIGITDNESKDIINNTSTNIIDAVIKDGQVSSEVISSTTLEKLKKALESGSTITTKVETSSKEVSQIAQEELKKIDESINDLTRQNNSVVKVAHYLDIHIMLESQNGNTSQKLGNIYQLDKPVVFTVAIPTDLKVEGRSFYIVRIHNGVSTILNTVMNDDGTLSFGTDRFSTYALVYEDQKTELTPKPDDTTPPPTQLPESVPQTNDSINADIYVAFLSLSILGFAGMRKWQGNKKKL